MASYGYAKKMFGKTHRYLKGTKYTVCGKKVANMKKVGKSQNMCSACGVGFL